MAENRNGKFRQRKTKFAPVSNSALQDDKLSLKAKGLYSLIQSYINIPNYDLRIWKLIAQCKDGKKAFYSAWKELKDTGYLKQYRIPSGEAGAFEYEYELLDEANLSTPALINLTRKRKDIKEVNAEHIPQKGVYAEDTANVDNPAKKAMIDENLKDVDHMPPKGSHTECINNDDHVPHYGGDGESPKMDNHIPLLATYAQSTTCSEHPVLDGGCNSNTKSSNTEFNNIKSISQSEQDRPIDQLREKLKEQIEYPFFELNFSNDLLAVDVLVNYMVELITSQTTVINGIPQSRKALQPYIDKVDSSTIQEFLQHMQGKELRGIKNPLNYWRSAFVNYLKETELIKASI